MTTTENLMQSKPDISISVNQAFGFDTDLHVCLLYTSPSPRDKRQSRMPSSA